MPGLSAVRAGGAIVAGPSSPPRSLASADPYLPLPAQPCPHPPDQGVSQAVPSPAAGPVAGQHRGAAEQLFFEFDRIRALGDTPVVISDGDLFD